jgi:hypothetical protein
MKMRERSRVPGGGKLAAIALVTLVTLAMNGCYLHEQLTPGARGIVLHNDLPAANVHVSAVGTGSTLSPRCRSASIETSTDGEGRFQLPATGRWTFVVPLLGEPYHNAKLCFATDPGRTSSVGWQGFGGSVRSVSLRCELADETQIHCVDKRGIDVPSIAPE